MFFGIVEGSARFAIASLRAPVLQYRLVPSPTVTAEFEEQAYQFA